MTENKIQIKPYPLGAHCEGDYIRLAFVSAKESCGVLIYDKKNGKLIDKVAFSPMNRVGNVHCAYITGYKASEISYQFYEEDKVIPDKNAAIFVGKAVYGKERTEDDLKAGFLTEDFDWQNDRNPHVPYKDSICYLLHVRGFTKHTSSKVSHKGTFCGILEKLPYLQEIGVTTVELQPAYEFLEIPSREERKKELPYLAAEEDLDVLPVGKLNYWGYKNGYYYAPKAAYGVKDASVEFKELVREFHRNGMEIIMQFYFPKEMSSAEIPAILRYWVLEYHVDGFHLMGENIPVNLLAGEPVLADTKLWYYGFDADVVDADGKLCRYDRLASYQDEYLYTMRKFLKGDEDMVKSVAYHMRHIPKGMGRIHFMSNYYGMTLMDMVSYDRKHNEDNGEGNRDGNDYNCSWNCGEEGKTRRKKVNDLRKCQIKNAMTMMMFSQSTPLIFMGDEFGNSQNGNNNPYCQDNNTTWVDWSLIQKNQDIYCYWKDLVALRKNHPILHPAQETQSMDYMACGYPDLSYHGQHAWRPQIESYSRYLGIMYCGKYAQVSEEEEDSFFYVAINMYWENQEVGLPKLPKGLKWSIVMNTNAEKTEGEFVVPPRSIVIYKSIRDESMKNYYRQPIIQKDRTFF